MGRQTLSHGTEKNRELTEKGDASPSPRKSEASASRQASKPRETNSAALPVPRLPEESEEGKAEAAFDNDLRALLPVEQYGDVIGWLSNELHQSAIAAEIKTKGEGARLVLAAYAERPGA
jgi:hypothetical protein